MDHLAKNAPHMTPQDISILIDQSPMNRGLSGASWVKDAANRAVIIGSNVMLFEINGRTVEFHWLKTGSGTRQLIKDTREAMRRIFEDTGADVIYGLIPDERRDSKLVARWVGAKSVGRFWTACGNVEAFVITPELLEG